MGLPPSTSVLCCGEQPLAAMIEPLDTIAAGAAAAVGCPVDEPHSRCRRGGAACCADVRRLRRWRPRLARRRVEQQRARDGHPLPLLGTGPLAHRAPSVPHWHFPPPSSLQVLNDVPRGESVKEEEEQEEETASWDENDDMGCVGAVCRSGKM